MPKKNKILFLRAIISIIIIMIGSMAAVALELDQVPIVPASQDVEQPVDPCEVVKCYSAEQNTNAKNRRDMQRIISDQNIDKLKSYNKLNRLDDENK